MEDKLSNNRIDWIDISRGLGIVYVMLGHTYIDWKFAFWFYAFHMALFFFLAGTTFYCKEPLYGFIKRKFKNLMIPYIFFAFTITIYNYILEITHDGKVDLLKTLVEYNFQSRYNHLWFLPCLFIAEILMYLISGISTKLSNSKKYWLGITGLCFGFMYIYRKYIGIDLIWNADLSILGLGFMCIGKLYQMKSYDISYEHRINYKFLLIGAIIHIMITYTNFRHFSNVDWYNNNYGNAVLFLLGAISGVVLTILFSKKISSNYLMYLGKNSILWYGFHRIIIDGSFILYNKLGISIVKGSISSLIWALVSTLLAIVLLIPVNYVINKYFPYLIGKKKDVGMSH